ncbi:MAG TPA: methionine synthase [Actinopolymorphaceae bacterium]
MTPAPPWRPGAATGVGSLPYDDPLEACRIVFGELPELPHLPELPARGPGASMIGRTCALLVDLGADLRPSGWRLTGARGGVRGGIDQQRARSLLGADLDALQIVGLERNVDQMPIKVQVTGPWTLAATVERPSGGAVLGDSGARRDLAQSLAEGVAQHLADLATRVPGAAFVVQFDEPALPAVLRGAIPTPSGFSAYRPVEQAEARQLLEPVLAVADFPVVHCCAPDVPVSLLVEAGAKCLSFDLSLVGRSALDDYAAAIDGGVAILAGAVPTTRPVSGAAPSDVDLAKQILRWWRMLGFDEEQAGERVVVTPACGLGDADPAWTREVLTLVREAGAHLADRREDEFEPGAP